MFICISFSSYAEVIELSCKKNIEKNWNEIVDPQTKEDIKKMHKVKSKNGEGVYAYISIDTELKELTYFDLEEETISWSSSAYKNKKRVYSNLKITENFYKIDSKYISDFDEVMDALNVKIKINRKTGYTSYRYNYDGSGIVKGKSRKLIRYLCFPTEQLF